MGNMQITLAKDELFKAIFEYVKNHYPQINGEHASIKFDGEVVITGEPKPIKP